jgi:hypothetical protein
MKALKVATFPNINYLCVNVFHIQVERRRLGRDSALALRIARTPKAKDKIESMPTVIAARFDWLNDSIMITPCSAE